MNLNMMRKVDHYCGLPLCWMASFITKLFRMISKPRKRDLPKTGNIVIFKFFGLGSIVQIIPLLRAIKQTHPNATLTFVTFSSNQTLVERLDICDEYLFLRTKSLWVFIKSTLTVLLKFWKQKPDAVIDLEFYSKFSTLLSFLSRAQIRVGFHLNDFWRYNIITHPINFNYFRHISEIYSHAGEQIGVKIDDYSLCSLRNSEDEKTSVVTSLKELGWTPDRKLIGINVNAGDLSLERRWSLENWHQAITKILTKYPNSLILLTGSPNEKSYVNTIQSFGSLDPHCVKIIAGHWSIPEFTFALTKFDLFVTNDSGPVHLAATTSVPIISLWGPERPEFYAPRVNNHHYLYANYHCSPCLKMFTSFVGMWCDHRGDCMTAISVDDVVGKIEEVLAFQESASEHQ